MSRDSNRRWISHRLFASGKTRSGSGSHGKSGAHSRNRSTCCPSRKAPTGQQRKAISLHTSSTSGQASATMPGAPAQRAMASRCRSFSRAKSSGAVVPACTAASVRAASGTQAHPRCAASARAAVVLPVLSTPVKQTRGAVFTATAIDRTAPRRRGTGKRLACPCPSGVPTGHTARRQPHSQPPSTSSSTGHSGPSSRLL